MKRLVAALLLLVASACAQSIVQSQSGNNGAGATTVTATWDNVTVAGNALFAAVAIDTNASESVSSCTDSNGNTYVTTVQPLQGAATVRAALLYVKNAAGGSGTVTCNLSASRPAVIRIVEVSGLDTQTQPDTNSTSGTGTATAALACGTTSATRVKNVFVIGVAGVTTAPTFTAGAGFTLQGQNSNGVVATVAFEHKTVSAYGTQSATFSTSANVTYACITVGFKSAIVGTAQANGPVTAGTGADDAAVGARAWTNPTNITASDNARAQWAGNVADAGVIGHYLKATNFGFVIPAGAVIVGIKIEYEGFVTHINLGTVCAGAGTLSENIKLVLSGVVSGQNVGNTTGTPTWPASAGAETFTAYGGSNDMWGVDSTVANWNDATSGVVYSPTHTGCTDPEPSSNTWTPNVDSVRGTIYYTQAFSEHRPSFVIFSQTRTAKTIEVGQ